MASPEELRLTRQQAAESRRRTAAARSVLDLVVYLALVRQANTEQRPEKTVDLGSNPCAQLAVRRAQQALEPSLAPWDGHARWALGEANTLLAGGYPRAPAPRAGPDVPSPTLGDDGAGDDRRRR